MTLVNSEDKPKIGTQQDRIGTNELSDPKPALLKIDKAAVLAPRTLDQLITLEAAGSQ